MPEAALAACFARIAAIGAWAPFASDPKHGVEPADKTGKVV
ncbi:hypothetical protein [Paraburkholderia sacchari]